ncbi:aminotransferase-like domain-containing protein [Salegentibacter echinorum]|nr:PLP-dependent aminotransferase family protein [Salegentibacter echinorum]
MGINIPFPSFIHIDRRKKEPVYMQIVYQFINAVRSRVLESGDQLPGSRIIAKELKLHRKTIVAALAELQEQGWINTRPNIGVFIANPEVSAVRNEVFQQPPQKATYNFRKEFILDSPSEENISSYSFTDGTADYRIVKPEELVRFYASVLKRKKQTGVLLNSTKDKVFFKDQLSYYLNITRGFHLSRKFLLPIAGMEQALSILARLLINSGDIVLVEELSYFLPNMVLGQAGARIKTIPVDENGMNIDFIEENFKAGEIRLVYLNPTCQYPTGVQLSETRKTQLLDLAERYNFIVIEDDTDFEFSLTKNKQESLFRKNGGNRVIYLGSFARFLLPGFQMNFIIAPEDLLHEAAKYLNIYGKPDVMMEKALGEIIHQGDIHRYQRKSKKVIAERKELFAGLLKTYFKDKIEFDVPKAGLAFWIEFKEFFPLTRLQEKAKEKDVFIPGICLYQNRRLTALRLGFAHFNQAEMEEVVELLAGAYFELMANRPCSGKKSFT